MPGPSGSPKYGPVASGLAVLVVEDDQINQRIAREMLQRAGYSVQFAADGAEALRIVRQQSFAAILMDIEMPVLDGYETTRRLRNDPQSAHLPVIAMTAHTQSGVAVRCLEAGMNDYIEKPVEWGRALTILQKWMPQSPREAREIDTSTLAPLPGEGLPPFPGIDLDLALRRASGNQELAASLIRMFADENRDSSERLEALALAGQRQEALVLTHKIKGSAGTIAASAVAAAARAVEQAFSSGADWEVPLRELEQHLNTVVMGAVGVLEESTDSTAAPLQVAAPEQVFPLLTHLELYLTENNMRALDCFRDLQTLLRGMPELVTPLCRVADPLERLDFVEARARLSDVAEVLERIRRQR